MNLDEKTQKILEIQKSAWLDDRLLNSETFNWKEIKTFCPAKRSPKEPFSGQWFWILKLSKSPAITDSVDPAENPVNKSGTNRFYIPSKQFFDSFCDFFPVWNGIHKCMTEWRLSNRIEQIEIQTLTTLQLFIVSTFFVFRIWIEPFLRFAID